MFKKLFGKGEEVQKDIVTYAPSAGRYAKVEDIPGPIFAQKMMGEGFGINPTEGEVVSPIAGRIDNIFPTKHAIDLEADNGLGLLVHIGLGAVQLDGEGSEVLVSSGDEVNAGDPLIRLNLEYINNNAKSAISPTIITNTDQAASVNICDESAVTEGETKVIDMTMN